MFADDLVLHMKNISTPTKVARIGNQFINVTGYKVNIQQSVVFDLLMMNLPIKKKIQITTAIKKKIKHLRISENLYNENYQTLNK